MFKKLLNILGNQDKEIETEPLLEVSDITINLNPEPRKLTNDEQTLADLQARAAKSMRDKNFLAAALLQRKSIEFAEQHGFNLRVTEYIKLARYLQASGKNDEGWLVFNKSTLLKYTSLDDKMETYNAMRIFLQREGRYKLAVQYGIASYLLDVEKDRVWINDKAKEIGGLMSDARNSGKLEKWMEEHIDLQIELVGNQEKRLLEKIERSVIKNIIESLLKKTKLQEAELDLVDIVAKHIASNTTLKVANLFRAVPAVLNKYDS